MNDDVVQKDEECFDVNEEDVDANDRGKMNYYGEKIKRGGEVKTKNNE